MKVLMDFLAAALIVFYFAVVVLILNPRVNEDYKAYFIERTTALAPSVKQQLRPLYIGRIYSFNDEENLGFDGWSHPEDGFRWSAGRVVSIVFRTEIAEEIPDKLDFSISVFPHGKQVAILRFNGSHIGQIEIDSEQIIGFSVQRSLINSGMNTIHIELPNAARPKSNDKRIIGLGFRSMSINNPAE